MMKPACIAGTACIGAIATSTLAQTCDPTEIFAPQVVYGVDDVPLSLAMGDLDGDGDPDLAVANSTGSNISVLLNNGDGTFRPQRRYGVGAAPSSVAMGDLDGDGELTFFDFLAFQNLFDLMDPAADFDGDGEFTFFDFLAFQNAFAAGCP